MNQLFKLTYIPTILLVLLTSCRQTKHVPEGKYLLKRNNLAFEQNDAGQIEKLERYFNTDISIVIKQKPNAKTIGFKLGLAAFNLIDSAKVAHKHAAKLKKIFAENRSRIAKQDRINSRRIDKAQRKGKSWYTEKIIPLKDTTLISSGLRERLKYKFGDPPVVFDTILLNKSVEQMNLFLKSRGYYYGNVYATVDTLKRRKVEVSYHVKTGKRYVIDSVYLVTSNASVKANYNRYISKNIEQNLIGKPFDKDILEDHRESVAKFMRDDALYGFSYSHLNYLVDTTRGSFKVSIGVVFSDKMLPSATNPDSLIAVPHKTTYLRNVYFHLCDTVNVSGKFSDSLSKLGLTVNDGSFLRTMDTLTFVGVSNKKGEANKVNRTILVTYNHEPSVSPEILEMQNFTESKNYFKEYYLERTFSRLMKLGVFQVVKPEVIPLQGSDSVDVHYYLVVSRKQSFSIEPRATNTNGFLGVMASMNYSNKNLFGGAQKLTFSISGGVESQPLIIQEEVQTSGNSQGNSNVSNAFNTIEFGPLVRLEMPGLFPVPVNQLSKRQNPRMIGVMAYNYQYRAEFKRHLFQLNYGWKFQSGKNQTFQLGLPGAAVLKYVNIEPQAGSNFLLKLNSTNDLFFRNAFSSQLIWEDFKLSYAARNNKRLEYSKKFVIDYNASLSLAGNILSRFHSIQDTNTNGQYTIFKVGYSQFTRIDNDLIVSNLLGKKSSIHARVQAGMGIPYGNSKVSLPYDYSFFAGGTNDNRGWRARTLGPGGYKYYQDTNRTATQIGDIRIASSLEWRYSLGKVLKLAVFADVGNVWLYNEDAKRPNGKFSADWYKQLALSGGIGLRFDMDYFVIRTDFGLPITNPAMPSGEKWIFQGREQYVEDLKSVFGLNWEKYNINPFPLSFNFGIGYPF